MATPYKILSDGVIDKLKSSGLPNITEEFLDEIILANLRTACIKFKACKQKLSDRDDMLQQFNIDLTDEEIEILIYFLFIEYLSANYINAPELLKQALPSKDFHAWSHKNHLDGLKDLRSIYASEARQMASAYSNQDSALFKKIKISNDAKTENDKSDENNIG